MDHFKQLIIRRHGPSLAMTIPHTIVRELGLQQGDSVFLYREGNVVRLRFGRAKDMRDAAELMDRLKAAIMDEDEPPLNAA